MSISARRLTLAVLGVFALLAVLLLCGLRFGGERRKCAVRASDLPGVLAACRAMMDYDDTMVPSHLRKQAARSAWVVGRRDPEYNELVPLDVVLLNLR